MIGTLFSFSVMAVSIRELARSGFNIFEILAIRSGGSLVILLALLAVRPDLRGAWASTRCATPCTTPRNIHGRSA
jgi:hypothetical protein